MKFAAVRKLILHGSQQIDRSTTIICASTCVYRMPVSWASTASTTRGNRVARITKKPATKGKSVHTNLEPAAFSVVTQIKLVHNPEEDRSVYTGQMG